MRNMMRNVKRFIDESYVSIVRYLEIVKQKKVVAS